MNKQHKVGDSVTINARYSCYHGMKGIITEVIDSAENPTVFPYTVKFDDGDENYLSAGELK